MKKVITYGSFDLCHKGHYRLLQRAKALGDYLIVALPTDAFHWKEKQKKCDFTYEERKKMLEALRDLREGNVQKHRQFGRTIVPTDAYRPDQRFFANKKLPQDLPDMAVSILADNSGSTGGERIQVGVAAGMRDSCVQNFT